MIKQIFWNFCLLSRGAFVFGAFVFRGFCLWGFCLLGLLSLGLSSMGLLSVGLLYLGLPSGIQIMYKVHISKIYIAYKN